MPHKENAVWPGRSQVGSGYGDACERVYTLAKLVISKAIEPIVVKFPTLVYPVKH